MVALVLMSKSIIEVMIPIRLTAAANPNITILSWIFADEQAHPGTVYDFKKAEKLASCRDKAGIIAITPDITVDFRQRVFVIVGTGEVIGAIFKQLNRPAVGSIGLSNNVNPFLGCFGKVIHDFSFNCSIARSCLTRQGYPLPPDARLGLSSGFPVSG